MTSHLSERFHDNERHEVYLDIIQSSLERPAGCDQAWLLDRVTSADPAPARMRRPLPRLAFRWFALPHLPVPFLTWASS